jgi:hypothetical protein
MTEVWSRSLRMNWIALSFSKEQLTFGYLEIVRLLS